MEKQPLVRLIPPANVLVLVLDTVRFVIDVVPRYELPVTVSKEVEAFVKPRSVVRLGKDVVAESLASNLPGVK
jgi:hypothetical protein